MNRNIEFGAYNGPVRDKYVSRTLGSIEGMWNGEGVMPGTFDELLSEQIERAMSNGNTSVAVLDLGSGSGALIKNIVNDDGESDASKTVRSRRILAENPGFNVRMVGLTDATTPDAHLRRTPIKAASSFVVPHHTNSQIDAENVEYSITENQRITDFLDNMDMAEVDLVISTAFFVHLKDGVFEQTLADVVNRLKRGGKLIMHGYHSASKAYSDMMLEKLKAMDTSIDSSDNINIFLDILDLMRQGKQAEVNDPRLYEKQAFLDGLSDKIGVEMILAYDRKTAVIERL